VTRNNIDAYIWLQYKATTHLGRGSISK